MRDVDSLLKAFHDEWEHWGRSTLHLGTGHRQISHTDDEPVFAQYAIKTYCYVVGDSPSVSDISDDEYYWSAVGISYGFKKAGFKKSQFPFSSGHSTWIRAFIKARRADAPALYHGYRLTEPEAVPEIGDLIGYTYEKSVDFEGAQAFFDRTRSYPSHTDLVVAKRHREVDVIGFNVEDSVTMKTVPTTADGHIADRTKKWFVVLKRQGF